MQPCCRGYEEGGYRFSLCLNEVYTLFFDVFVETKLPINIVLHVMTLYFVFLVAALLAYLVIDGLITGKVWVRGARSGISLKQWAHKRSREEEPASYWVFITLYSIGAVGIVLIVLLK